MGKNGLKPHEEQQGRDPPSISISLMGGGGGFFLHMVTIMFAFIEYIEVKQFTFCCRDCMSLPNLSKHADLMN